MRFECRFAHPDRPDQEMVIRVTLPEDDIKAINCLRRDGDPYVDVKSKAYALRHAYRMAPQGFVHIGGGVRQVMVH
jgi:hypothetical protein